MVMPNPKLELWSNREENHKNKLSLTSFTAKKDGNAAEIGGAGQPQPNKHCNVDTSMQATQSDTI